jgi:pentose-5-phosphate-3-epimerase
MRRALEQIHMDISDVTFIRQLMLGTAFTRLPHPTVTNLQFQYPEYLMNDRPRHRS